jgi:hypothetical protein
MRIMRRFFAAAAILVVFLSVLSCAKKPSAAKPQKASVADDKSGFAIMAETPLWDLSAGTLTLKETLQIGERVDLLGQSARATQAGKQREFIAVRRDTGKNGWARADFIVSRSILAVTTDEAIVYDAPKNTAATTTVIPPMTVLAIRSDSGGQTFIRVTAYDSAARTLLRNVFLRNEGVSAKPDDVQSVILLALAGASKNAKQKEAFLSSAVKDHPGSAFLKQITEARTALRAAPPVDRAVEECSRAMVVGEENVAVRDSPDERTGRIVGSLASGRNVDVVEKTKDAYTVEGRTAPWYRIEEPAGWVHGASLAEAP